MSKQYEIYIINSEEDLKRVTELLEEQGCIMATDGISILEWAQLDSDKISSDMVLVVNPEDKAVLVTNEADLLTSNFNVTNEEAFRNAAKERELIASYVGNTDRITLTEVEDEQDYNNVMQTFQDRGYKLFSGHLLTDIGFHEAEATTTLIASDSQTKQVVFVDKVYSKSSSILPAICAKMDRLLPEDGINSPEEILAELLQLLRED